MSIPRICALLGIFALSACHGKPAGQNAINGAIQSEETVEDADARAERLAEQAALLNAEAGETRGANRQALRNEARADMSEALNVERQGEQDSENIAVADERAIRDKSRR